MIPISVCLRSVSDSAAWELATPASSLMSRSLIARDIPSIIALFSGLMDSPFSCSFRPFDVGHLPAIGAARRWIAVHRTRGKPLRTFQFQAKPSAIYQLQHGFIRFFLLALVANGRVPIRLLGTA